MKWLVPSLAFAIGFFGGGALHYGIIATLSTKGLLYSAPAPYIDFGIGVALMIAAIWFPYDRIPLGLRLLGPSVLGLGLSIVALWVIVGLGCFLGGC